MNLVNRIFSDVNKILARDRLQDLKLEEEKRRKEIDDLTQKVLKREVESKKELFVKNQTSLIPKLEKEQTFPLKVIVLTGLLASFENPGLQMVAAFFLGAGSGSIFVGSDIKKERSLLALDQEKFIQEKMEFNKKALEFHQEQLAAKKQEHQKVLKELKAEEERIDFFKKITRFCR
ncbi:MAG: hypothetical protein JSS09_06245 [Verrucomicrobia bacterium]|nr:hypothetical protein [Verrucomicrobiota bacterium]